MVKRMVLVRFERLGDSQELFPLPLLSPWVALGHCPLRSCAYTHEKEAYIAYDLSVIQIWVHGQRMRSAYQPREAGAYAIEQD